MSARTGGNTGTPSWRRRVAAAAVLGVVLTAVLATALAPGAAAPPAALAAGGCTQTYRFFYVTALTLHETVTAHFTDTNNQATIDTVQQANVSEPVPPPPAAARRNSREIAFFYALISGCRVGDYNLGFLNRTISVPYQMHGSWSTTGSSGQCDRSGVLKPSFSGTFMRPTRSQVFYPPPTRTRLELSLTAGGRLDCRYQYLDSDGPTYRQGGLDGYTQPGYSSDKIVMGTAPLLNRRVVTIPFHFSVSAGGAWNQGSDRTTATATGTLTLTRYRSCTLRPSTPVGIFCPP